MLKGTVSCHYFSHFRKATTTNLHTSRYKNLQGEFQGWDKL